MKSSRNVALASDAGSGSRLMRQRPLNCWPNVRSHIGQVWFPCAARLRLRQASGAVLLPLVSSEPAAPARAVSGDLLRENAGITPAGSVPPRDAWSVPPQPCPFRVDHGRGRGSAVAAAPGG
jgi:hypothetical protein